MYISNDYSGLIIDKITSANICFFIIQSIKKSDFRRFFYSQETISLRLFFHEFIYEINQNSL